MKLLIEVPTWLGDAVMTTPAIENISKSFNKPQITIIGSKVSVQLFQNNPIVAKTFVLDKKYQSLFRLSRSIGSFDLFISFRGSFRSIILKFLISSKRKFQFNEHKYKNMHQVEKYNNFVNDSLKIKSIPGRLNLFSKNSKVNNKSSKLSLGINPGASYGNAKQWLPERFAEVAIALSGDYEIFIFGSASERKTTKDIEKLMTKKGVKNFKNLAGRTSIQDLINRISSLDLFITGDSGPMHIAATFNIPTVAIFGPTNDLETFQWKNDKSVILKKTLQCQPCMQRSCPLKHHDCMKLIQVDKVLEAVKKVN